MPLTVSASMCLCTSVFLIYSCNVNLYFHTLLHKSPLSLTSTMHDPLSDIGIYSFIY